VREEDLLLLECLEDIHRVLDRSLKKISAVRSVHVTHFQEWADELRNNRRIFEEISFPARLIVEHLMHTQHRSGQVALEAGQLSQTFSSISGIKVEQFGIIKFKLGDLEVTWRDGSYTYYLYPDKVELRAVDEKSAVKLFFSIAFSQQMVEKFPELVQSPNVVYIHPELEQGLKKVQL
jgi:hypothetical protein